MTNWSVLCNNPKMTLIPSYIPAATLKLVIEKTLIRRVSAQAFSSAVHLECLRVSFNPISNFSEESLQGLIGLRELRLNDNELSTFPWHVLSHLPHLWLLDLQGNILLSIPTQAAAYCKNITYLDLSNNRLTTLSSSVISTWLMVPGVAKVISPTGNLKLIIGLHNNPWECDCRLSELVNIVKIHNPTTALMDPGLKCSRPEHLSGALFSNIELNKCQTPSIHVAEGKVIAETGSTVSLNCATTGVPTPAVSWRRLDNVPLNGTVIVANTNKAVKWSTLNLSDVSHQDSGDYLCRASNLMGIAGAAISLIVINPAITMVSVKCTPGQRCVRKMRNQELGEGNRKLIARFASFRTSGESSRGSYSIRRKDYFVMDHNKKRSNGNIPEIVSLKMDPSKISGLLENRRSINDSSSTIMSRPSIQLESDCLVRTLRVIGGTYHSVSLAWRSPKATNITLFSVLYTTFGERDMSRINVGPGKTKITIDGLMPQTKYIVCVCVKGIIPQKEQCVIFSTDEVAHASGTQKLINAVVITVACVIVVPLTLIVCCGALKRRCRKFLIKPPEDDYQNNSFVTFESLAAEPRPDPAEVEYLTHHSKDEANRLLSPRSSLDSEEVTNHEAQQNEYFC
ncbi:leucine-rich repeat, immunoglobulin-like domain and transmembrane domain-containing protein 1a [Narcine bancroftii]|uniref:leucine-rich repeat, immunoglobulin-like domain and transmembrane domain-containing protein 1a n=1 Tax=Narcine bancroftii TaxID=1343680 RepID=UPI003831A00A